LDARFLRAGGRNPPFSDAVQADFAGISGRRKSDDPVVLSGVGLKTRSAPDFLLEGILNLGNFKGVIESFADAETEKVFNLVPSRKLPGEIQTRAKVKLDQLHAASELNHLRVPPSNRPEKLSGNLRDLHGICITDEY
jgi:proteic killer suppression protein